MAITLRKPPRRAARILLALVFSVGMMVSFSAATEQHALALSCSPGSSTTSTVDGYPVVTRHYTFGATCDNVPVGHQCEILGTSDTVQAIECADIYMSFSPSSVNLWGDGEYYCQGFGYEQCDAMSVDQVFEFGVLGSDPNGVGTYGHPGGDYTCSGSSCPSGSTTATGRAWVDTYHFSGTLAQAGGTCSYLMVTGDSLTNTITVPDGAEISGGSNPAITNYLQVCFE